MLGKWRGTEPVSFNIVLFAVKSERERFHLSKSGFQLVCNQLCWSYPTETIVHILDVRKIHEAKEEKKSSSVLKLLSLSNVTDGLGKGISMASSLKKSLNSSREQTGNKERLIPIIQSDDSTEEDGGGDRGTYKPPEAAKAKAFSPMLLGSLGKDLSTMKQTSFKATEVLKKIK